MKQISLWESPEIKNRDIEISSKLQKLKLPKGQTIYTLVETAKKLVEEKLGKYKETSKCVFTDTEIRDFFDEVPDDSVIGIDTETTRLIFKPSINDVNQYIIGCDIEIYC